MICEYAGVSAATLPAAASLYRVLVLGFEQPEPGARRQVRVRNVDRDVPDYVWKDHPDRRRDNRYASSFAFFCRRGEEQLVGAGQILLAADELESAQRTGQAIRHQNDRRWETERARARDLERELRQLGLSRPRVYPKKQRDYDKDRDQVELALQAEVILDEQQIELLVAALRRR